jgi:hypothetical protein
VVMQGITNVRVLLVTWSPSESRTQQRLQQLSASLRSANHSIVVCVPPDSLSLAHAAEADKAGVEYIFVRPHRSAVTFALGSWVPLLWRFRPHLIHLCPDLPPAFALKLAVSAHRWLRPPIPVLVETGTRITQAMNGATKASWRDAESSPWAKLGGQEALQLLCPDLETLSWYQKTLGIPAYRLSLLGRGQPRADDTTTTPTLWDVEAEIQCLIRIYQGIADAGK